jgi:hypothetical protein
LLVGKLMLPAPPPGGLGAAGAGSTLEGFDGVSV